VRHCVQDAEPNRFSVCLDGVAVAPSGWEANTAHPPEVVLGYCLSQMQIEAVQNTFKIYWTNLIPLPEKSSAMIPCTMTKAD